MGKMITLYNKKEDCCGCTACKSVCPNDAITMNPDEEGFLYPFINIDKCVECGICQTVCPFQKEVKFENHLDEPLVLALKHKLDGVRMSSASGGAYTAISDYILNESGIIYGAKFNKEFIVHHARSTTTTERDEFRGSKYVQSDMREVFCKVKKDLKDGKLVLFTGTACQVAGLRCFLGNTNIDKLIINDIICHGSPSPLLWKDYLDFIQKKSKLKSYTFRSKDKGWHGYNVKVVYENGKCKVNTPDVKIYANIFATDLALRPSCYNCKFSKLRRPSDITIGDFWGIEKVMPELDDDKGVSLVLVNTRKGQAVFREIINSIDYKQSNTVDCLQLNLQQPTKRPDNRDQFWRDYYNNGFIFIAKLYAGYSFKVRAKGLVKMALIKVQLLNIIKNFLDR
jgi:coenzyme F420-reducing hydrogenase beta subunit